MQILSIIVEFLSWIESVITYLFAIPHKYTSYVYLISDMPPLDGPYKMYLLNLQGESTQTGLLPNKILLSDFKIHPIPSNYYSK